MDHRRLILDVQENEAADHGVELALDRCRRQVALDELDVAEPGPIRALPGNVEGRRGPIDSEHAARRTNTVGHGEGDVAHPATEIEDPHARSDPGEGEDHARCRREDPSLLLEPLQLGGIVAE